MIAIASCISCIDAGGGSRNMWHLRAWWPEQQECLSEVGARGADLVSGKLGPRRGSPGGRSLVAPRRRDARARASGRWLS
eukprot:6843615-Pyramimonas_sp.AAC.1